MANQTDGVARQGLSEKTKLVLLIAGIIILAATATITFLFHLHKPQTLSAKDPDSASKSLDTRSAAAQQASATANAQAVKGDVAGALQTLDAAIAHVPASSTADLSALYQEKATVAANGNQKDVAVRAQQSAMKLQPDDWRLVESLGNLYLFMGDAPNAIASYQQADHVLPKTKDYDKFHAQLLSDIAKAQT